MARHTCASKIRHHACLGPEDRRERYTSSFEEEEEDLLIRLAQTTRYLRDGGVVEGYSTGGTSTSVIDVRACAIGRTSHIFRGTGDLVAKEAAYGRINQQALENSRGAPLSHWKESEQ
ncbi:hypothetical protein N7457_009473 [Penicillium paradoxum]|uniref:uncharacterized protein n=1 Tax=Penicillium paradoxum TaxID=176176 RepID=UPI00254685B7|nr:uncharacterized protein N7457_009473 [Penicillium paradoxum]KAJ5774577.1 hypothetical protein N7457_009473 [Penicillium paradoxum]